VVAVDSVEDCLRHRSLQAAGHSRPSSTTKRSVLATKFLSRKPEQLLQHRFALVIDGAQGLKHHCAKRIVGALKTHVVLAVLLAGAILFARIDEAHTRIDERARHSQIDGEADTVRPVRYGHITRATACGWAKDTLLLHHRIQETIGSNLVHQVAKSVVPSNQIPSLCAANGVIAINIDGLRAQRTGDFSTQHRHS
jgi:hypothetical protein